MGLLRNSPPEQKKVIPKKARKECKKPCINEAKRGKTGGIKLIMSMQMAFYDYDLTAQIKAGKHELCEIERMLQLFMEAIVHNVTRLVQINPPPLMAGA